MMDVVTYMKINNGDSGSFFTGQTIEDGSIFKPIIRNVTKYSVLDLIYHTYGATDLQKCRAEMCRLFSRYSYFRAVRKGFQATRVYAEYLIVKKQFRLLTKEKKQISSRAIMGRVVYVEQLIHQIENDHRIDDLDLKEMVVEKLNELLDEILENSDEDDE